MNFRIATLAIVGVLAAIASTSASAQATRTWVSGVGDDANPCSRTAPCKTFAGAISKTATSGEINCLDPAGFGAVTITKSITIDCRGTLGGILAAGTTGIVVNGSDIQVALRNLSIDGTGLGSSPGLRGVRIIQGAKVIIEDSVIFGFGTADTSTGQGIKDERTTAGSILIVRNTSIHTNKGAGLAIGAAAVSGTILDNVISTQNGFGLAVANGNNVSATRSTFSNNAVAGIYTDPGGQILGDNLTVTHNATGVQSGGTIRLSNSTVGFNSTSTNVYGAGSIISYGNNRFAGNAITGPAPTAAGATSTELGQQ